MRQNYMYKLLFKTGSANLRNIYTVKIVYLVLNYVC